MAANPFATFILGGLVDASYRGHHTVKYLGYSRSSLRTHPFNYLFRSLYIIQHEPRGGT